MILIPDIDAAPESVLAIWWRSLPAPQNDEEKDVVERLAIRCEALGMVDASGKLLDTSPAKG